jgi:mRNA interferase RelE/StbE
MSAVPERVVPAIIEFVYGDLASNPRRVGNPLERELAGPVSARRGSYRIQYDSDLDDAENLVSILRVAHRADVYRMS